ncbi:uncharacterized protein EDB91DRAFT_1163223 [Suillus paluster]|uniref:uncharacterized protein n=1 Tax=Suillus paluster TaxID=48578 RepID=UPI001B875E35|nr:uncharacterized protein EDB91DRAFT_1163223 [Suillus paluster]KAG1727780.1 hypothetical protein EDB91DRAFT_1163223 [Suillus paluster]
MRKHVRCNTCRVHLRRVSSSYHSLSTRTQTFHSLCILNLHMTILDSLRIITVTAYSTDFDDSFEHRIQSAFLSLCAMICPQHASPSLRLFSFTLANLVQSHNLAKIMRFSFLAVIAALTAAMSVSATQCKPLGKHCKKNSDCCSKHCNLAAVGLVSYRC